MTAETGMLNKEEPQGLVVEQIIGDEVIQKLNQPWKVVLEINALGKAGSEEVIEKLGIRARQLHPVQNPPQPPINYKIEHPFQP